MFCQDCGKEVEDNDSFCRHCGKALTPAAAAGGAAPAAGSPPEEVLFTFGPFGLEVCDGKYSVWKWQHNNSVYVELTNYRLCVLPNTHFGVLSVPYTGASLGPAVPFMILYTAMLSVEVRPHPMGLGIQDVLEIKFQQGDQVMEKSIAAYQDKIRRATGVIRQFRPDLFAPAPVPPQS